ncbi:glycosyltransferase family 2 protein [Thermospira aquatica]|uniref:Glycosyltransferase family 2 protein n=1 Tax=Thermospira aquatica TaxID=2828656 RepID=A0AAX3BES7_9SPIR|nr:glycosyltransferase family 2 protein [Thermospira aquatica]URA10857.1 glycosyltransferase family 2 protein [Thermospira aquatica]
MRKKILVIIPAYNEEKAIGKVIEDLLKYFPEGDILVVNDGSRDNTSAVASQYEGVTVVNLPVNLGIGGAVQTGFKYAARYGYDIAIQFDGDGQHLAEEIPLLLKRMEELQADMVIGSRFLSPDVDTFRSTMGRRIGIKIFEWINSLLIRQRVTDNTSGFRAFNREAILFLAENYPVDYPEPEAVILLGRNRFKIGEVQVKMRERQGGHSSIFGWRSAYYMIKVLVSIFLVALRYRVR